MGRAREAALTGTVRAVAKYGSRKATMGDIALIAGIAKATLYNHFRTREELYAAVLIAEVDAVATEAMAADPPTSLAVVLATAARVIGNHPGVRKIAAGEPAVLAALAVPSDGPAWQLARARVGATLSAFGVSAGPAAVELVVRYLASAMLMPMTDDLTVSSAVLLTAGLATAGAEPPVSEPAGSTSDQAPAGSSDTSS
jgi:AcrR family transcriptional regulator